MKKKRKHKLKILYTETCCLSSNKYLARLTLNSKIIKYFQSIKMNPFGATVILSVFLSLILVHSTNGELFPENAFKSQLNSEFLPLKRKSLDDCHLKYYKYGKSTLVKPAFGVPAYLKEFAHMAAIGWTMEDGTISWDCGGSLITENFVLSAAHCAANDDDKAPDVARFGDINIYSAEDDQYAQQLKIVEVRRHPQHKFVLRYNDIALMRLEKNIMVHETVAPACLWIDDTFRFPKLEATGWGTTGFTDDKTPILLKVTLTPTDNSNCNNFYKVGDRKLPNGIMNDQMCAGDIKMDTCPGDSGGPLQMKLMSNGKITPFILGITSFGKACGSTTPGVYTRVSSYIQWIESEVKTSFDPITCALRYIKLREYEDDVIFGRSATSLSIDSSLAHMELADNRFDHRVALEWKSGGRRCGAVLVAENFVVTSAECTQSNGKPPNQIRHGKGVTKIAEIIVHPGYNQNSYYNDIALLKLAKDVELTEKLFPTCLWFSDNIPVKEVEVTGWGPLNINSFDGYSNSSEITYLDPRATVLNSNNCSVPKQFLGKLSSGIRGEQLCTGTSIFLVPKSCDLDIGGPVERELWHTNRYFPHLFGINSFGLDCGYGEPSISTRISSHAQWMQSIILPDVSSDSAVHYVDRDDEQGDCKHVDGNKGACVPLNQCPKLVEEFKVNPSSVNLCSVGNNPKLCCPHNLILNKNPTEIDNCVKLYRSFYTRNKTEDYKPIAIGNYPFMAAIGYSGNGGVKWNCMGSLVTKSYVVTSASCAQQNGVKADIVRFGLINLTDDKQNNQDLKISGITIHSKYDQQTKDNDIALIQLNGAIRVNNNVVPACLWQDPTRTPFDLKTLFLKSATISRTQTVPMYNADCQKVYKKQLTIRQICGDNAEVNTSDDVCRTPGDLLEWDMVDGKLLVPYLVGFYSYEENCKSKNPAVFTKISSYIKWIKSAIK